MSILWKSLKGIPKNLYIYLVLIGVHIAIVWSVPYWPTQDGPSHIYNLTILKDLLNGGNEYGNTYDYELKILPNLGFHVIAYPFLSIFSPVTTERIFLTLYIVFLSGSVCFFLRVFKQALYPYVYFQVPVIFNFPVMMGFYSFSIAIPLLLFALAVQWLVRHQRLLVRFFASNILGVMLFCFHFIVFGLFLVLSAVTIGFADRSVIAKKRIWQLLIVMLPCIIIMILYVLQMSMFSSTLAWQSMFSHIPGPPVFAALFRLFLLKLDIFTFSMAYFGYLQLSVAILVSYLFCLCLYTGLRTHYASRANRMPERSALFLCISMVFAIYIIAPFRIGEGSALYQRFPVLIYLLAIPLLEIPHAKKLMKYFFSFLIAVICSYILVSTVLFYQQNNKIVEFLAGQHVKIEKGSFLAAYRERDFTSDVRVDVLLSAVSYYAILNKSVNVGNYEAGTPFFPVRFKPHIRRPPLNQIEAEPATIDWLQYPSIRYLFGSDVKQSSRKELEKVFELIFEEGKTSIWRRYENIPSHRNGSLYK